jgi:hypothetical protein
LTDVSNCKKIRKQIVLPIFEFVCAVPTGSGSIELAIGRFGRETASIATASSSTESTSSQDESIVKKKSIIIL